MTIARRLLILLGVPLLALATIGFFLWRQLAAIETGTLIVAEKRTESLQLVGNISRGFTEGRVLVRSCLLARTPEERAAAVSSFAETKKEVGALLERYGDTAISGDRDRRFYDEYRRLSGEWTAGAEKLMALAVAGRVEEAVAELGGRNAEIGERLSAISAEWIRHNEEEAKRAGNLAAEAIEASRRRLLVSTSLGLLLSAIVGILTFRRIATPIRALQETVETIAAGDYSRSVPFTGASDETGALARSIDVLKGGASAMEDQRWVKAGVARLAGEVQEADSLAELGERFVSGLVPLLGGGVAAFYLQRGGLGSLPQDRRLRPRRRRRGRRVVPGGRGPRRRVRAAEGPGRARGPAAGLSQDLLRPRRRRSRPRGRLAGDLPRRGPGRPRGRLVPPLASARGGASRRAASGGRVEPRDPLAEPPDPRAPGADAGAGAEARGADRRPERVPGGARGAAGGAEGHRGADAPHPGVDRRRDPRRGHGRPDRLRQPRRLPDARLHRAGARREPLRTPAPPPPDRRERVPEGRVPDVRGLLHGARRAASTTSSSGARTARAPGRVRRHARSSRTAPSSARSSASATSPSASASRRSSATRTSWPTARWT